MSAPSFGPCADLGERVRQLRRAEAQVLLAPEHRERQEVALRSPPPVSTLDDRRAGSARRGCCRAASTRDLADRARSCRRTSAGGARNSGSTSRSSCCRSRPSSARSRRPPGAARVTNSGSGSGVGTCQRGASASVGEQEPVEAVGRQRQQVGQVADRREGGAAGQLDRHRAADTRERSSSTACAWRDRLTTQRMRSPSCSRR